MRLHPTHALVLICATASLAQAAPVIDLEIATERGVQITAPREWLQQLAGLGITNVRIRTATANDNPAAENRGTAERPRFHVVGILTPRNELRLPGGTFRASDGSRLAEYLARLAADGPESLTAELGRFGLTEKEYAGVYADLAQPLNFATEGQSLQTILAKSQAKFSHRLAPDAAADRILRTAKPVPDEVGELTAGTALAIVLKNYGLALRPEKPRGAPVTLRIVSVESVNSADDIWPIGWDPQTSSRETAPMLFEFLNVEIDGYSLQEAVDAIAPRLKLPIYWDHAALAANQIDPAKIQVHLPKTRIYYKRILDRVLSQARLSAQLRVDEAGTAFLWITK